MLAEESELSAFLSTNHKTKLNCLESSSNKKESHISSSGLAVLGPLKFFVYVSHIEHRPDLTVQFEWQPCCDLGTNSFWQL